MSTTKTEPDFGTTQVEGQSEEPQNDGSETPETAEEKAAAKKRADGLRAAYGEATTALREKHRTEFEALYVKAAKAKGIDYKPKPTPEQKAEQEMEELFTKFPHLREKAKQG